MKGSELGLEASGLMFSSARLEREDVRLLHTPVHSMFQPFSKAIIKTRDRAYLNREHQILDPKPLTA